MTTGRKTKKVEVTAVFELAGDQRYLYEVLYQIRRDIEKAVSEATISPHTEEGDQYVDAFHVKELD